MSNFSKKILIEQSELDRLQQRQIRDYSPELHNMSELQRLMVELFEKKGLSDEAKLSLLKTYQARFDKLQKDTGLPSTGALSKTSTAPEIVNTRKVITQTDKDSADANANTETDSEDNSDEVPIDVKPTAMTVEQFGIQRMYEQKAKKLLMKITQHSDILTRNADGEIVVHGKAEPGTNFDSLFKSMVTPKTDLNQPGIDKFLEGLRSMGVRYHELSSKALQAKYAPPPPSGPSQYQLAALKAEPSSIEKVEPSATNSKSKLLSILPSTTRKTKASKMSNQQGTGVNISRPPGKRANILYLY